MASLYLFLAIYPYIIRKIQKNLRVSSNVFLNSSRQLEVPLKWKSIIMNVKIVVFYKHRKIQLLCAFTVFQDK